MHNSEDSSIHNIVVWLCLSMGAFIAYSGLFVCFSLINRVSRDYYKNMSRRLSWVMAEIGMIEEAVMSRRRCFLITEILLTLRYYLVKNNGTSYIFGSQTEGTTTDGLGSDVDILMVMDHYNLIQDLNDWVPARRNLLMIPNERFPGYCKMQLLNSDGPDPKDVPNDKCTFDEAGRVILLHLRNEGIERHGPAEHFFNAQGSDPNDFVPAIRCKTWPKGYKLWSRTRRETWPTPEMMSFIENSGCFVVQVAHSLDEKKSESWRISTSLAERCLMFSLNITQIRCYTLTKMIVKTFIDPVIPDVISSYICKNLLFHCVENARPDFWHESNLLRCVNQILLNMLETVRCMNCPNYFNESMNLLLGKVNKGNRVALMRVIWKVLVSDGGFLAEIRFDNVHQLIHSYDEIIYKGNDCSHVEKRKHNITLEYEISRISFLGITIIQLILSEIFHQRDLVSLQNTMLKFALESPIQYETATLLFPFLCSHLATLKANEHIRHGEILSSRTLLLYERSLDSDVTSSRLKFASYLYCTGQFERAMLLLADIDHRVIGEEGFIAICVCDPRKQNSITCIKIEQALPIKCLLPSRVSMCVTFSQAERRCCPRELQYDMYRSTEQEKLQRDTYEIDAWMDLACIDSSSYLRFLLYMCSRHLGHRELRLLGLEILKNCTNEDRGHTDTVYNLLGQCYAYENRFDEAFACYCKSLRVRPTNNAARWHIILLLNTIYQNE